MRGLWRERPRGAGRRPHWSQVVFRVPTSARELYMEVLGEGAEEVRRQVRKLPPSPYRPAFWELSPQSRGRGATGVEASCLILVRYCGQEIWSGRRDSNSRPPAPKAGALPGCATPRHLLLFLILDYSTDSARKRGFGVLGASPSCSSRIRGSVGRRSFPGR